MGKIASETNNIGDEGPDFNVVEEKSFLWAFRFHVNTGIFVPMSKRRDTGVREFKGNELKKGAINGRNNTGGLAGRKMNLAASRVLDAKIKTGIQSEEYAKKHVKIFGEIPLNCTEDKEKFKKKGKC